ncbi:MAG: ATP-binding protein [bacterium]
MKKITQGIVEEYLRQKEDGSLYHREQKDLEFKESFNLSGLAEYFRDFAAFSNNVGGFIIFGVTNSPRKLTGLSAKSIEQFNKIDEQTISGFINEHFAPYIDWEMDLVTYNKMQFGIFYAYPAVLKPVICKKGDDK